MPELPEVEITARLLGEATRGAKIDKVRVQGLSTLKSFEPPIEALTGLRIERITRRGKHLLISAGGKFSLLIHLMSAGRLQLYDKPASIKDRSTRIAIAIEGTKELRLREFGTKQSAWAKLIEDSQLKNEAVLSSLGPEAWPKPPALEGLLSGNRPLHSILRDQRVIAGIGRSWVDEILHLAKLSPFKKPADLSAEQMDELRESMIVCLSGALAHYEKELSLPLPDKLPMPLRVHRHNTEPCWRCSTTIEAVFYENHVMCYCPVCQTDGKVLKDRRLSRLLK
ncbi:MAG: DNA-formamidopyrimidine glycosylase family protein [Actinomycetota bacterium]|nr:DNA-formamidopyrimidine glycosylase [Actinomycetota bacterium]